MVQRCLSWPNFLFLVSWVVLNWISSFNSFKSITNRCNEPSCYLNFTIQFNTSNKFPFFIKFWLKGRSRKNWKTWPYDSKQRRQSKLKGFKNQIEKADKNLKFTLQWRFFSVKYFEDTCSNSCDLHELSCWTWWVLIDSKQIERVRIFLSYITWRIHFRNIFLSVPSLNTTRCFLIKWPEIFNTFTSGNQPEEISLSDCHLTCSMI